MTCWNCKKKYKNNSDLDECPRCGAGLIESNNDEFVDFISEYDGDGF